LRSLQASSEETRGCRIGGVNSDMMDEKLRRLEELERSMEQREKKILAAARRQA